jgi:hypothetical protein
VFVKKRKETEDGLFLLKYQLDVRGQSQALNQLCEPSDDQERLCELAISQLLQLQPLLVGSQ